MNRVYGVDDDRYSRAAISKLLQQVAEGEYELTWANSYEEGLQGLQQGSYDLLLVDYLLGNKHTGVEFLAGVRDLGIDVPAILLTGSSDLEIDKQVLSSGFLDYLEKASVDGRTLDRSMKFAIETSRNQRALKELQNRFEVAVKGSSIGLWEWDIKTNCMWYSDHCQDLLGYELTELPTSLSAWLECLHPEDRAEAMKVAIQHMKQATPYDVQYQLRNKNGDYLWFRVRGAAVRDGAGKATKIAGSIQNISSERQAREALVLSERRVRLILDAAADGVIGLNECGIIEIYNRAAERIFGFRTEEMLGKDIRILLEKSSQLDLNTMLSELVNHRDQSASLRKAKLVGLRKDQSLFPLELSISSSSGGDSLLITAVLRDVSDLERIEASLRQAQRMESIGQLAAGIAHELNTPIQYIGDNLRFLSGSFSNLSDIQANLLKLFSSRNQEVPTAAEIKLLFDEIRQGMDLPFFLEQIPRAIEESRDGVERVTSIVKAMKEFAHPGPAKKVPLDLNRALTNAITVSTGEWKYSAEVVKELDPNLPLIMGIPSALNQAFLNIIVNAAHAISEVNEGGKKGRGVITVSTKLLGESVQIRIQDTGTGIAEKNRSRIFDPFFTTKRVGQGTGQGLSIVHAAIVDTHEGRIDLETELGKGSTFILTLPCGEKPECGANFYSTPLARSRSKC